MRYPIALGVLLAVWLIGHVGFRLGFAPVVRVWLSYGGWPAGAEPREQVALEPCTSMGARVPRRGRRFNEPSSSPPTPKRC